MKKSAIPVLLSILFVVVSCSTSFRPARSDVRVLPLGGEVRVTDGSIVYALPMTVFEIDVIAERTIETPGPYARYAEEMLGLDDVIKSEAEIWSIEEVAIKTTEELDPAQFYVIEGTTLMETNVLALKESGLILDINPDIYSSSGFSMKTMGSDNEDPMFPDRGADEYYSFRTDTAYKVVRANNEFIRVPYLVEKKKTPTASEVAASAAKKLLELREGKHLLLTGETNVFPQDGAALEEINRLDREYTALFAGKRRTEKVHFRFWYTPAATMSPETKTLFNFSTSEGVKPAATANGKPVVIELTPSGKTRELNLVVRPVTSEKEIEKNDKLFYRVPDVADVRIYEGDYTLCTTRKLVYQYGNTVTLPSNFIIGK